MDSIHNERLRFSLSQVAYFRRLRQQWISFAFIDAAEAPYMIGYDCERIAEYNWETTYAILYHCRVADRGDFANL